MGYYLYLNTCNYRWLHIIYNNTTSSGLCLGLLEACYRRCRILPSCRERDGVIGYAGCSASRPPHHGLMTGPLLPPLPCPSLPSWHAHLCVILYSRDRWFHEVMALKSFFLQTQPCSVQQDAPTPISHLLPVVHCMAVTQQLMSSLKTLCSQSWKTPCFLVQLCASLFWWNHVAVRKPLYDLNRL